MLGSGHKLWEGRGLAQLGSGRAEFTETEGGISIICLACKIRGTFLVNRIWGGAIFGNNHHPPHPQLWPPPHYTSNLRILLKLYKCRCICLTSYSSAVYGTAIGCHHTIRLQSVCTYSESQGGNPIGKALVFTIRTTFLFILTHSPTIQFQHRGQIKTPIDRLRAIIRIRPLIRDTQTNT